MPDRPPVLGANRNAATRAFDRMLATMAREVRIAAIGALTTPGSVSSDGLLTGLGRRRILTAIADPLQVLFPVRRGASSPLESFIADYADVAWERTLTAEGTRLRDILGTQRTAALAAGDTDLATLLRMADAGIDRRLAAARAFSDTRTWVDPNGYRLSDRVWNARTATRTAIDREVRLSVARGDDAIQVARRLEPFLAPGNAATTMTPGGRAGIGNAATRRLARTELSRAYNHAAVTSAAANPFVLGMRYHTSGVHKDTDSCDDYASQDVYDLGVGGYPVEAFPTPPQHPHCRCFGTSLVMPADQRQALLRHRYGLDPMGATP